MPIHQIEEETGDALITFRIRAADIQRVRDAFKKAYNMPMVLTEAVYDENFQLVTPEEVNPKYTDDQWICMQIQKYVNEVVLQTEASNHTENALDEEENQTEPLIK